METQRPLIGYPEKLRGFIASENLRDSIFHHHTEGGLRYRYPLIHYHFFKGNPTITGWLEGVDRTKKLFQQIDHLKIGDTTHKIIGKKLIIKYQDIGISKQVIRYHFITPWMALNIKNYEEYKRINKTKRLNFLENILTGNILSASKGLNHTVEDEIKVSIVYMKREQRTLKGVPMIVFKGVFDVNFALPELFGLGKSVSRGFGAIRRI